MDRNEAERLFEKWRRKLRLTPAWDIRLQFVEDPEWRKTGDFKVDCDDKKAILMLNAANPKQENIMLAEGYLRKLESFGLTRDKGLFEFPSTPEENDTAERLLLPLRVQYFPRFCRISE